MLWIQRNGATFHKREVTIAGSVQEFWKTGIRQLRALAKRECRRAETRVQGTRLMLSILYSRRNTTRADVKYDKPRTTTGSNKDTGVANQAKDLPDILQQILFKLIRK
ncbi:unnamed protein product [Phytophthora lilii]|uniref:Unnamed protein product n=1 Tax=Phytophthora lilii TaxID=2077276 RepID=A0A9W6YJV3_9STRA|nr:unnamed protein product [Phytophthora lilii]